LNMPGHARPPQNPNQQRNHNSGNRKSCLGLGVLGAATVALGAITFNLLTGGCDNQDSENRSGGDIPATATPAPGESSNAPHPDKTTPEPIPTASHTSKRPEASPSKTVTAELPDPWAAKRRTLTERYTRCGFRFTNAGDGTLSFDLSADYGRSSTSVALWDKGETQDLKFQKPEVVLAPVNDKGATIKGAISTKEEYGGTNDPLRATAQLPRGQKDGSMYGVFIATEAKTPYVGYEKATVTATYCGAIAYNEPGNDPGWRSANEQPPLDAIYSHDITIKY
jgi:hypothetical protein